MLENQPSISEVNSVPETKKPKSYFKTGAIILGVFVLGYFSGGGKVLVSSGQIQITKGEIPATSADYSLLWEALDILNEKYVDRPLDQRELLYGAVRGLVSATGDPYTSFFDPQEATSFADDLRGSFGGIGAEIGVKNDQLVIIAPLDNTPAQRAGLVAGDIILAINDESTAGMNAETAVTKIRGPEGSQVKLNILHANGTASEDIIIVRAKIEIKSVTLETKEVNGKKIAVIHFERFGDDTKGLLDAAVDQIVTGNYQGLVVDMRNNPGGYLDTAVSALANWVDNGTVVLKEKGFGGAEKVYTTRGIPRLKGVRTIVLVNAGSASAAEIVAGALQDYGVATLVGETTFGKGSVQELVQLRDNTEVKITVAKWYTPKDRGIDGTGLEPDVALGPPEDPTSETDPQMDRALELLK